MGSERSCIVCRAKGSRWGLLRIVLGKSGLQLDEAGVAEGRGAYLHRTGRCLGAAISSLERAQSSSARVAFLERGFRGRLAGLKEKDLRSLSAQLRALLPKNDAQGAASSKGRKNLERGSGALPRKIKL